eukprot:15226793-Heterocapsa_arctica.AAC.1
MLGRLTLVGTQLSELPPSRARTDPTAADHVLLARRHAFAERRQRAQFRLQDSAAGPTRPP